MTIDQEYSGEISFVDGSVVYKSKLTDWTVPLATVRLIGEYTTANGPHIDDYFFVFMTAPEDGWHEASFYAKGRDETLARIAQQLGTPIEPGLCNSTHYTTRILWPPQVKGEPLMRIVAKPTKWRRIWARISGVEDITLSEQARSVFTQQ